MQVGTYPTRNFATLGTIVTTHQFHCDADERLSHFCLAPYVAIGVGLYLHHRTATSSWWAWRTVSEDPSSRGFLLIVRTGRIVTAHRAHPRSRGDTGRVPPDTRMFQHTAKFYNGPFTNRYSYGRRLPGLRFRASLPKELTPPRNLPAPGRRHSVYIVLGLRTLLCF